MHAHVCGLLNLFGSAFTFAAMLAIEVETNHILLDQWFRLYAHTLQNRTPAQTGTAGSTVWDGGKARIQDALQTVMQGRWVD